MYLRRLKDLREDEGLTQAQVAEILKIRQNVYGRYELGHRALPLEHLLTLADFYKTSTDYLLGRTNNPAPPQRNSPFSGL